METVKNRSESPLSKGKTKNQLDTEKGDATIEQTKMKKKSLRNKQKTQTNGKEDGDIVKNGNENDQQETNSHDNDDNTKENGSCENKIEIKQIEENDTSTNHFETAEVREDSSPEVNSVTHEEVAENLTNDEPANGASSNGDGENSTSNDMTNETESSAKNDVSLVENSVVTESGANESIEDQNNGEVNGTSDSSTQSHEYEEAHQSVEISQNGINGSDTDSIHENSSMTKDDPFSPDAGVKEDGYFSNKISSFLGKWNTASLDQKQEPDVSSSKILNESDTSGEAVLSHPYFSKVTGRPSIRERLSNGEFHLNSKEELKTPKNHGFALNDSFRVRTDPQPRINREKVQESTNLRKFSNKRCLNASDDVEEDEDELAMAKRRKLNEKTPESGFLGNMFWSPFRKKSLESEDACRLPNTESKISRFLSPFWFWKKTGSGQKMK